MYVATPIRDTNVFNGSFHSKLRLIYEPSEDPFRSKQCDQTMPNSSSLQSFRVTARRIRAGSMW